MNLLNQTHEQHIRLRLSPFCRETLLSLASDVVIGCLKTLQQLAQCAVRVCREDRHGVCFVEGGGGFRRRRESAALIGSLVDYEMAVPGAKEALCADMNRCMQRAPEKAGVVTGAKDGVVEGAWFDAPNVFFGYLGRKPGSEPRTLTSLNLLSTFFSLSNHPILQP